MLSREGGRSRVESNCLDSSDDALEPLETGFRWRIGPDEYGQETLFLMNPDGSKYDDFVRWND